MPSPWNMVSFISFKCQLPPLKMITAKLHKVTTSLYNWISHCEYVVLSGDQQVMNSRVSQSVLQVCCCSFILLSHTLLQSLRLCWCWWEPRNQCTQTGIRGTWFWITPDFFVCIIHSEGETQSQLQTLQRCTGYKEYESFIRILWFLVFRFLLLNQFQLTTTQSLMMKSTYLKWNHGLLWSNPAKSSGLFGKNSEEKKKHNSMQKM